MPTNDEIVRRFFGSGAVNFEALGKFVTEMGPEIALSGQGNYGVLIGHYNFQACFYNRVPAVSNLGLTAGEIATEVKG